MSENAHPSTKELCETCRNKGVQYQAFHSDCYWPRTEEEIDKFEPLSKVLFGDGMRRDYWTVGEIWYALLVCIDKIDKLEKKEDHKIPNPPTGEDIDKGQKTKDQVENVKTSTHRSTTTKGEQDQPAPTPDLKEDIKPTREKSAKLESPKKGHPKKPPPPRPKVATTTKTATKAEHTTTKPPSSPSKQVTSSELDRPLTWEDRSETVLTRLYEVSGTRWAFNCANFQGKDPKLRRCGACQAYNNACNLNRDLKSRCTYCAKKNMQCFFVDEDNLAKIKVVEVDHGDGDQRMEEGDIVGSGNAPKKRKRVWGDLSGSTQSGFMDTG